MRKRRGRRGGQRRRDDERAHLKPERGAGARVRADGRHSEAQARAQRDHPRHGKGNEDLFQSFYLCITFLYDVLQIQSDAEDPQQQQTEFVTKSSELFDHVVYLAEVCDVLCIAMAELPNLLTPPEARLRILLV